MPFYNLPLDPPPKDSAIDFQTFSWLQKLYRYFTAIWNDVLWNKYYNQTTANYRTTFAPNVTYDLVGNTVATTNYYNSVGSVAIPVAKEWNFLRLDATLDPTGTGKVVAVRGSNIGAGEVNGIYSITTINAAGTSRSIVARAEAAGVSATGNIEAFSGTVSVGTGAAPTTSRVAKLSHIGPLKHGIFLDCDNPGDTLDYGFVLENHASLQQSMIQYNQRTAAPGSFLRMYDSGSTLIFDVDSTGSLAFKGTGQRLYGDFSNATSANRTFIQTITTNGNTSVGLLPNGTSVNSNIRCLGNSNPAAALPFVSLAMAAGTAVLDSNVLNGGTVGAIEIRIAGAQAITINTDKSAKCFSMGRAVATKTTNYTATKVDSVLFVDATSGNVTITLPAAADFGAGYSVPLRIKRKDASANTVTIQRAGADTIDNALTSFTLAAWGAVQLESDGVSLWGRF